MGIFEAIKKGFGAASKNVLLVTVLFIFNVIWNMVNMLMMPAGTVPPPDAGTATPPAIPTEMALATLGFSLLFILISIFMQGGTLGVIRDHIKEGSTKLAKFASYGLKYYLRLLGLGILIILLVLLIAIIAALIIVATTPLNNVIVTVIASVIAIAVGVIGIYFVILLVMSPYALVCEESGVIAAMKKSLTTVKKAFLKVLLLLVMLILIAIGIGVLLGVVTGLLTVAMPPKVGQVVIGIVNSLFNGYFGIVMTAAFMTFYLAIAER